jgi:hypothetical protein
MSIEPPVPWHDAEGRAGAAGRAAADPRRPYNYWPTAEQELMLRAALLDGPAVEEAWRELRPRLALGGLGAAERRLVPLLYGNLKRRGISDPLLSTLQVGYLEAWSRNRWRLDHACLLLDRLSGAGIPTLLLKGAALVLTAYEGDGGLRPMADLDLAVPTARAGEALVVFRQAGWTPFHAITPSFLRVKHAGPFVDGAGRQCDLHWHVFEECCRPDDDDDLWRAAYAVECRGRATRVLSPSDQLLHVCVHGLKWASQPGIRWIADATRVLATAPIDWARVVAQARRRRYVLRMRESLAYLRERMAAPVPASVLAELALEPVSRLEHFERRVLGRPHRVLGQLPLYWCHHRRGRGGSALSAALTFPSYLRHAWDVATVSAVPGGLLTRAARRLRLAAQR